MQQRRLRLGDILDDYCPRERRITNHAVVAMIEDQVKQTRCTTCDADHEYKQARVPVRRKKDGAAIGAEAGAIAPKPRPSTSVPVEHDEAAHDAAAEDDFVETPPSPPADASEHPARTASAAHDDADPHAEEDPAEDAQPNEDGPVHRRLIRATLPRPEGQQPEWKNPDFTIRQPSGGRGGFDGNRNGHRPAGRGGRRVPARAQGNTQGQPTRFGGQRQGNTRSGSGQPHGQGNRSGAGRSGQGHGQGQGQQRGQRQGGHGRKRGR